MTIQNITYKTLVDIVVSYIKTNCVNISNYDIIHNSMKNGFSTGANISSSGGGYTSSYNCKISKIVNAVDASVVDTDMQNFLSHIEMGNKLNLNITEGDFLNFINDLVSFCSTKMGFATGQFTVEKYLIYNTESNDYMSTVVIGKDTAKQIIKAKNANDIINMLFNVMKQTLRNIPCIYTYSFA